MRKTVSRLSLIAAAAALLITSTVDARPGGVRAPRLAPKAYKQRRGSIVRRAVRQFRLSRAPRLSKTSRAKQLRYAKTNIARARVLQARGLWAKALVRSSEPAVNQVRAVAARSAKKATQAFSDAARALKAGQPKKAAKLMKAGRTAKNRARRLLARAANLEAKQLKTSSSRGGGEPLALPAPAKAAGLLPAPAETSARKSNNLPVVQKADAEQPSMERLARGLENRASENRAPEPRARLGQLKTNLRNKDLGTALSVLKSMEKQAGSGNRLSRAWKKFQVARARRIMRKAAVRYGKEAIKTGGAASDQELRQSRPEYAQQARQARAEIAAAVKSGELSPEQARQARSELRQNIRSIQRSGSNYSQARKVLNHLKATQKKFAKKPVRRLIAGIGRLVFGSAGRSHRKLDRALIREVRHLSKQGVNGQVQARLLLANAKSRGLERTFRFRFAQRKAIRRLNKTIRQAVKDGDPKGVETAYLLKEAYGVDKKGEDYRLSERDVAKMNRNIQRAEIKLVDKLSRQAEWIAKHPNIAQQYGFGPEAAAQVNRLARDKVAELVAADANIGGRVFRRLNRTDKRLNARKPGIVRRIASLPLKVALLPFKIVKFFTVTQYRALRYAKTGGAPPPPLSPERLNAVMQNYLPDAYGQQQGGQQAQADAMGPYGQYM